MQHEAKQKSKEMRMSEEAAGSTVFRSCRGFAWIPHASEA